MRKHFRKGAKVEILTELGRVRPMVVAGRADGTVLLVAAAERQKDLPPAQNFPEEEVKPRGFYLHPPKV